MHSTLLWTPSDQRKASSRLTQFMQQVAGRYSTNFEHYQTFHRWSIEHNSAFWQEFWQFAEVIASKTSERAVVHGNTLIETHFFPDAQLNYAENLLRRKDDTLALIFWGEHSLRQTMTHAELYAEVSLLAQWMRAQGITSSDCVAAYLPNMPQTIITMLAAASIGAQFTSVSPDFGIQGVMDRFGQVQPKLLVSCEGYLYNGKVHDIREKVAHVCRGLSSLQHCLIAPYINEHVDISSIPKALIWQEALANYHEKPIEFAQLAFDHPLFIMYSSGTTGVPKCIVHRAGGVLLKTLLEHQLHCDIKAGDRVFYFSTCSWMMWNWLSAALASQATLMLYDGSPFMGAGHILWDFADAAHCKFFGISAKFIEAQIKANLHPKRSHELASIETVASTGSPLVAAGFDFVYEKIKHDVSLISMSGGTDLMGCFVGATVIEPIFHGEIQAPILAMDVDVIDESGQTLGVGSKGELVCRNAFPSMPLKFLGDINNAKYKAAYFDRFPGLWHHGDYIERTEKGGYIIYGRSDATLNPGGVRIGTAEIYRQVDSLDEVIESLVIGQNWPPQQPSDVRVVLFVVLREGLVLDESLREKIKETIRINTTTRHVPARIEQVSDIPRTKSNKIVELAVRDVIHGKNIKNIEALANPKVLEEYQKLAILLQQK